MDNSHVLRGHSMHTNTNNGETRDKGVMHSQNVILIEFCLITESQKPHWYQNRPNSITHE
jgi:hypothetical protein